MNKLIIGFVFVTVLCVSLHLYAQDIPDFPLKMLNSNYRRIDREANIVPSEFKKYIIKEAGVGNVIFSSKPLPIEKEDEFLTVSDKQDFFDACKGLYSLAYFPARKKELVSYLEERYGIFYDDVRVILIWRPIGQNYDKKECGVTISSEYNKIYLDQQDIKIMPIGKDCYFKDFNLLDMAKYGNSTHFVELLVFLRFKSGTVNVKMDKVNSVVEFSSVDGSGQVIEKKIHNTSDGNNTEQPIYRDFIVSYGKCIITYKKK